MQLVPDSTIEFLLPIPRQYPMASRMQSPPQATPGGIYAVMHAQATITNRAYFLSILPRSNAR